MFPSAREIFINKEDNNIISEDDDDDKRKIKLSIPNIQTFFSEINKGNMPNESKFLLGGDELRIHALRRVGFLSESNAIFLEFLKSFFGQDI